MNMDVLETCADQISINLLVISVSKIIKYLYYCQSWLDAKTKCHFLFGHYVKQIWK